MRKALYTTIIAILAISCSEIMRPTFEPVIPDTDTPSETVSNGYAKGADISWLTEMEDDGEKFFYADGTQAECTALMKDIGFDAVRLRVWVNPSEGWCNKEDVLVKARRADELGMRLMIDFHYSDTWADPSKQITPAEWNGLDLYSLAGAVESHTKEVLQMLKDNEIDVEWVQVGNEINNGMLHPLGMIEDSADNFAVLANKGYDAVKAVYPDAKVIIHRSDGHKSNACKWLFNLLKISKVKYDIIGLSLYPIWWEDNGWCDWKPNVDECIATINDLISTFGKPVMICEIGVPVWEVQTSKEALAYTIEKTKEIEDCHGIFYWEPQTDGKWKPGSYDALGWNAYDKGAFSNGRPTAALDPFRN